MRFKNNGKYNDVYGKTLIGRHQNFGAAPQTEERFYTVNPACVLDRVGDFPQASIETLKEAIHRAKTARPQWGATPAPEKACVLNHFQSLINAHQEELSRSLSRENGFPLSHNRHLLQNLCTPISSGLSFPNTGVYLSKPTDKQLFSNLLKIISSGSLVWLPPQNMLCTASALLDLWLQAGGPPALFQILYSQEEHVSTLLSDISLQDIHTAPISTPCSPVLMLPEHPCQKAVVSLDVLALYLGGILCVPHSELQVFQNILQAQIQSLKTGDPLLDHQIHYGPMGSSQALKRYLDNISESLPHCKRILPEGSGRITRLKKPHQFVGDPDLGHFVWPTLWLMEAQPPIENWPKLPGPSFAILPYTDRAHITQQIDASPYYELTFPEEVK